MAFAPRLAAIGGGWGRSPGPLLAGTHAESNEARDQSLWSASARRWGSAQCSRSQAPAWFQSRRRGQHVIPLPQPISLGSLIANLASCPELRGESKWRPSWHMWRIAVLAPLYNS
jgi:hypothetical protein